MKKKYLILGGVALAGAGAYFLYKKNQKTLTSKNEILQNQLDAEKENALRIIAQNKKSSTISLQNRNSATSKIAVIQRSIGVNPDGIIGPQTLNKLKTLFPKLVNLTNANIEQIFTFCNDNPYLIPNEKNVSLFYGNPMEKPLIIPNNNSGVNVYTNIFKPFSV